MIIINRFGDKENPVLKGDSPGHPFRGNQYGAGTGGGGNPQTPSRLTADKGLNAAISDGLSKDEIDTAYSSGYKMGQKDPSSKWDAANQVVSDMKARVKAGKPMDGVDLKLTVQAVGYINGGLQRND